MRPQASVQMEMSKCFFCCIGLCNIITDFLEINFYLWDANAFCSLNLIGVYQLSLIFP